MDLDTIGAALRRKLGPLPVWVWAIFGGVVVYFLRKRGYFGGLGDASAQTLQPSQTTAATTPRDPVLLQPGESAYNPDTGTLTTAPGGAAAPATSTADPSSGTGNANNPSDQAFEDLAAAIIGSRTDSVSANSTTPKTHKPTALQRAKAAVTRGKIGPTNRARLRKAGYSDAEINYHLHKHTALAKPRKAKPKTAHTQSPAASAKGKRATPKAGTHTPTTSHSKSRTRSAATIKTATGGRTTGRKKTPSASTNPPRARTATATAHSMARPRPTTPTVHRAAPVQHPVSAAHQTATQKAAAAHAAKPVSRPPSAPAPRAAQVRAQAPAKTKPKPKPRHR